MNITPRSSVTIIGAGLTGCFMAILLAKRGYRVRMYERAQAESIKSTSKLAFNLLFRRYGMRQLQAAGLWDTVEPHTLRLKGFMTQVTKSSAPILTSVQQAKNPYYIIRRARLLEVLLTEAMRFPNVTVRFGVSLVGVNRAEKTILIQDGTSKQIEVLPAEVVLGADGVHSAVRTAMQDVTAPSQEYSTWSYKQVGLSKEWASKLGFLENVAYTWSRKEAVVVSHPNRNGSNFAILLLPKDKHQGFAALTSPAAIRRLIEEQFPALLPALPVLTEAWLQNLEGTFVTVRTAAWHQGNFMAILGDAAHGMYPFSGQGASAGFGDASELARLLDAYGDDWGKVFSAYQTNRKRHMDALAEVSKQTFLLYRRHRRADYTLIYEKFEALLSKLFPRLVCPPLAEMIAQDPGRTADYIQSHKRLRTVTTYLGMPILVAVVTGMVALQELLAVRWRKRPV